MIHDITRSLGKAAVIGALSITAIIGTASIASAMPAQKGIAQQSDMVDNAQYHGRDRADYREDTRYDRRRHGERYRRHRPGYTHFHQGHYYATPWWMGGPPVAVREHPRGHYRDPHIAWCMKHHRTYDPRTNTYIGHRGRPMACVVR